MSRSEQKKQTRASLLAAAAQIIRDGSQPTVAAAALAAGVHRATAYRYFPTPHSLLAEAALLDLLPSPDSALAGVPVDDPIALMDAAVRSVASVMFCEEAMFRNIVRVTIDRWFQESERGGSDPVTIRTTRRFDWIDRALVPLSDRLDPDRIRLLRNALALTFGSEALVVTRDVCGLEPDEATDVMRWAAAKLIEAALAESAATDVTRGRRR